MDNVTPDEVIRNNYKYDSSYKEIVDTALIQLKAHVFIYRCCWCFKAFNMCYCDCPVCQTYRRFCQQIYGPFDMEEDNLEG